MFSAVQFRNFCPSRLLSKNVEFKIYKTIILPLLLHGCENLVSHIKGRIQTEGLGSRALIAVVIKESYHPAYNSVQSVEGQFVWRNI
jgi:hypothetical protein